jgi:hypothetical protein
VHRVVVSVGEENRSLVVKRLGAPAARRNERVFENWLAREGLERGCPRLLGKASERDGPITWHVYEDIGDRQLVADPPVFADLEVILGFLAKMHVRFASHPVLDEVRSVGGDLGFPYFVSNVQAALRGVREVRASKACSSSEHARLCDRLADRLQGLERSIPWRAQVFRENEGPETLLHGDLWASNAFIVEGGTRACLIDWDHAGAGPASYDVSTLLLRFRAPHRPRVLERYRAAVAAEAGTAAATPELNVLFETAELARYANRLGWLAPVLLDEGNEWAWERIEVVEAWFENLRQVVDGATATGGAR